jgi:hypothetical protein
MDNNNQQINNSLIGTNCINDQQFNNFSNMMNNNNFIQTNNFNNFSNIPNNKNNLNNFSFINNNSIINNQPCNNISNLINNNNINNNQYFNNTLNDINNNNFNNNQSFNNCSNVINNNDINNQQFNNFPNGIVNNNISLNCSQNFNNELMQQLNGTNTSNKENEKVSMDKIIAVIFSSTDQSINYPIACLTSDLFSKLEEKLYSEYPELKNKNIFFIAKGNLVNKNLNLEQNNIKNGDHIIMNYE